jgi:hypothetical protein
MTICGKHAYNTKYVTDFVKILKTELIVMGRREKRRKQLLEGIKRKEDIGK